MNANKSRFRGAFRVCAVLFSAVSVLVLTLLLSSCNGIMLPSKNVMNVDIGSILVQYQDSGGAGQTIAEESNFTGRYSGVSGAVMITSSSSSATGQVTGRAYNIYTGELLASVKDGEELGFIESFGIPSEQVAGIFYAYRDGAVYIYNEDGSVAVVVAYSADALSFESYENGFSFNGVDYYVINGFVLVGGFNSLESTYFRSSTEYLGRYYYVSDSSTFVFDESGKLIYQYIVPSYADDSFVYVLNNGNLLIQCIYQVIDGEEYDYIINDTRYKLMTYFVNIETGNESKSTLGYIVREMINSYYDENFTSVYDESVENMAVITEIENNRLDTNQQINHISLSNNLITLFSYDDVVKGALDVVRISEDRYIVYTSAGNILVDSAGRLIGQLNNYRCITEKYIVASGKIYDHDLVSLLDLSVDGYAYFDCIGDNIVLSRHNNGADEIYLFSGSAPVYLCDAEFYTTVYNGYLIKKVDKYSYYDEDGTHLVDSESLITWFSSNTDGDTTRVVGYAYASEEDIYHYYVLEYSNVENIIRER